MVEGRGQSLGSDWATGDWKSELVKRELGCESSLGDQSAHALSATAAAAAQFSCPPLLLRQAATSPPPCTTKSKPSCGSFYSGSRFHCLRDLVLVKKDLSQRAYYIQESYLKSKAKPWGDAEHILTAFLSFFFNRA